MGTVTDRMRSLRRKKKSGRARLLMDDRGSAMITALVVGVVMMVFALSMLLISYALYAQSAKRTTQIQCRYMAGELLRELETELGETDSGLFTGLRSQMRKRNEETGAFEGIWVCSDTESTEGTDTLTYTLKRGSGDDELSAYELMVEFTLLRGTDSESGEEAAGTDSAVYDKSDALESEVNPDEWDEMASGGGGSGSYVVNISVTCKRGNEMSSVTRDCDVEF